MRVTEAVVKDIYQFNGEAEMLLNSLAGAWNLIAINQGMQDIESKSYQDLINNKKS